MLYRYESLHMGIIHALYKLQIRQYSLHCAMRAHTCAALRCCVAAAAYSLSVVIASHMYILMACILLHKHTGFDVASMKRSLLQPAEPAHDQSSARGSFRLFSDELDSNTSGSSRHKRRSASRGSSQYRNSSFGIDEYHEVDEGSWLDMDIIVSLT